MAINARYVNPATGEISLQAHIIVEDPIIRTDVQHVIQRARIYASKIDYDAGKAPIDRWEHEYGYDEYAEMRVASQAVNTPWVIRDRFPDGVAVSD